MIEYFFIRENGKHYRININDIHYIEANKNYVRIVTSQHSYLVHASLKHIEEQLPSDLLCKIHRSYIVALNKIISFDHEQVQLSNIFLPLSTRFFDVLKSKVLIINKESGNEQKYSPVRSMDFRSNKAS